jgi:hypothetical protein
MLHSLCATLQNLCTGFFSGLSRSLSPIKKINRGFFNTGGCMTTRDRIEHSLTLFTGMALGATVMYIFDASHGARRRAHARDKVIHAGHSIGRIIRKRSRDLMHRALGSLAEVRSGFRDRVAEIPDDILVSRVRSQLGHVVSHPGLLEIVARNGRVSVRGPVLNHEAERIRPRLRKIRGVRECDLDVETRQEIDRVGGVRSRSFEQAL